MRCHGTLIAASSLLPGERTIDESSDTLPLSARGDEARPKGRLSSLAGSSRQPPASIPPTEERSLQHTSHRTAINLQRASRLQAYTNKYIHTANCNIMRASYYSSHAAWLMIIAFFFISLNIRLGILHLLIIVYTVTRVLRESHS